MVNGNQQLPDGWTTERIGDICFVTKLAGFEFTKHVKYVDDGEIPVIRAQNVTRQGFQEGNFIYVKRDVFELLTRSRLVGDEVLMAFVGSVGNVGIVPKGKEYFLGPNVALIRVDKSRVFNKFLYYYLSSEAGKSSVLKFSKSTTQSSISMANIRDVHFPLLPLPEQERIVAKIEELFTQLEAGTSALERVQAGLRRYKASVLKAAVEGRLISSGHSAAVPVPGALPEGWRWTTVGEIGEISGGLTKNSKRDALKKKMPYLRVANVYANELQLDNVSEIGVEEKEIKRALLQEGDLLVVEGNGSPDQIGRVAIWNGSISPCLHQNHIIKVRFEPKEVAEYVLYWLLSEGGREQITKVASSTSGLYTLSLSKVSNLPVPLPPLEEQRRIVAEVERRLSVAREVETVVEKALARSTRLRQAVLKSAFEGMLVNGL